MKNRDLLILCLSLVFVPAIIGFLRWLFGYSPVPADPTSHWSWGEGVYSLVSIACWIVLPMITGLYMAKMWFRLIRLLNAMLSSGWIFLYSAWIWIFVFPDPKTSLESFTYCFAGGMLGFWIGFIPEGLRKQEK